MNKWNTTVISSTTNTQDLCRISAVTSQAASVSHAVRYSQTKSTDDYPSAVLQSALHTARSSGAITLAISRPCVRVEPQSCSLFGAQPSDLVPAGSSSLSRHASVISSQLPTGTDRLLPATTSTITQSTAGPGNLLIAVEELATSSRYNSLLAKGSVSTMSTSRSSETSENALSVLLAALPSDVASSLEAGFSVVTQQLFATSEAGTSNPTTRLTPSPLSEPTVITTSRSESVPSSSGQSDRPTSRHTTRTKTQQQPSQHTSHPTIQRSSSRASRPTSHPTSRMTEPPESHRPTTLATIPTPSTSRSTTQSTSSTSTGLNPSSTTVAESSQPTITPEKQQANGTIAGVATGAAAGAVLITLAIFFFLRRRQRQRALKAVEEKASQPYPAVAWLYDPVRSPPRAQSPAPQDANAAGALGMTQEQAKRSSAHAPEVVMPEGEPLLAPGRAATRESSPSAHGRGRSTSPGVAVR